MTVPNIPGILEYRVIYNPTAVRLVVADSTMATLAGDFNGDFAVDAADYIVWRRGLGHDLHAGRLRRLAHQLWPNVRQRRYRGGRNRHERRGARAGSGRSRAGRAGEQRRSSQNKPRSGRLTDVLRYPVDRFIRLRNRGVRPNRTFSTTKMIDGRRMCSRGWRG